VVLQAGERPFGLVVDQINGTAEIVVKPLAEQLKGIPLYAGATILGDGRVALILDVPSIAQRAGIAFDQGTRPATGPRGGQERALASRPAPRTTAPGFNPGKGAGALPIGPVAGAGTLITEHSSGATCNRQKLLLVGFGDSRRMAIPLGMVSRLEEFPLASVEHAEGCAVMQYRSGLLPLVSVGELMGVGSSFGGAEEDLLRVVVCSVGGRTVGFIVDRILGIAETEVSEQSSRGQNGILCTRVVQQAVTEVLDLECLVASADLPRLDLPSATVALPSG
jgi:two-component system chemotaxis sensor kinase CheA